LRLSSWLNSQYALNIRKRWKIITIYIAVTLLFFLLNYSLLIVGKLLVGSYNIFIFPNGGWRILFLVWLVELVIVGLLLSNRSIQNTLKLQQEAAELQKEKNTPPPMQSASLSICPAFTAMSFKVKIKSWYL
jgi:histidine kinase